MQMVNYFLARNNFLITFVNSLVPDQDRQNVGLDLDPNHLTLLTDFFKKVDSENCQQMTTKA